jgi:hypothetical protein
MLRRRDIARWLELAWRPAIGHSNRDASPTNTRTRNDAQAYALEAWQHGGRRHRTSD